jgi:hypothetical protein
MFRSLFTRRGGVAMAAATIGAASMSLAFAGTAGAAPSASLLIGSGSQTSYATMTTLGDLFNNVPGCDLTASTSIPSTLNCGTTTFAAGTPGGEQGFAVAADNPYNDFTVQAPAIGSGNGATALIAAGSGTPTQTLAYSRSSSGSKGNSTTNLVEYATDGVAWTTFNKVGGVKTPQAKITNITTTNLKAIWNGTLNCSVTKSGVTTTYTMDWICLGAKVSSPIDVYDAQTGSGTYATWQAYLGYNNPNPGGIVNAGMEKGWPTTGTDPSTGHAYATEVVSSHEAQFENQMASMAANPDAANAIYFMSLGRFTTTCHGKSSKVIVCAGTPSNDYVTFGQVDGIAATQATVQGTGGGAGVTFPVTRGLFNIYNNSSAAVPASQATLNFVGENGFLCKASTGTETDPQTGVLYRTEIENAIKANGFFPLDVTGATFNEGTVPHPGTITDTGYAVSDNATGNTGQNGLGYCLVKHN